MNTHRPYESELSRANAAKLQVAHRETPYSSAEIIYLRRKPEACLVELCVPMAEFGSGSYHEAAIRAEQPAYRQ